MGDYHHYADFRQNKRGRGGNHGGGRGGGRIRPPPHLKGREIGLFYKSLNQQKQKEQREQPIGKPISLPYEKISEIRAFLKLPQSHTKIQRAGAAGGSNYSDLIHDESIESEFKTKFLAVNTMTFQESLEIDMRRIGQMKEDRDNDGTTEDCNERIENEFQSKCESDEYRKMLEYRKTLPAYSHRDEIVKTIEENQVVLVCGDTGCGKTTQVSQYILDSWLNAGRGVNCRILCTQPRRISAITIAERVAVERIESLGESVGYQIRLENKLPRDGGSILYCTAGILVKILEGDKCLSRISHLILDEIHERDIVSDLTIGIVKKILPLRRDLKVILMSATMKADLFSQYFDNCPIIRIDGKTFPVESLYLEDVLQTIRFFPFKSVRESRDRKPIWVQKKNRSKFQSEDNEFASFMRPYISSVRGRYTQDVLTALANPESEKINIDLIEELIFVISKDKPPGAILVFLPGYDKINQLYNKMTESVRYPSSRFEIYTLHSMMPGIDQKRVFLPAPEGVRKIIIATNIAETSITINDVVYVIDSGKRKITTFDTEKNIQSLNEEWVTNANAKQRSGRAGRCQPGVCYHLYSRARMYTLLEHPIPEILCTRLDNTILSLKLLGFGDVKAFLSTLIDVPNDRVIETSVNLLKRLTALDDHEKLTPLGLHLAQLPLDPQIGKMILMAAIFSCVDSITSIAASLSFKDAFYRPMGKTDLVDRIRFNMAKDTCSDHLMLANVINEWRRAQANGEERNFCYTNFLSNSVLNQLNRMKKQFCEHLQASKFIRSSDPRSSENNLNAGNYKLLKAIVCSGLYPNIARIRHVKQVKNKVRVRISLRTPEDGNVKIHPSSVNEQQRYFESNFVTYHTKQKTTAIYLHDTTVVNPWSILFFGDMFEVGAYEGSDYVSVGGHIKFFCDRPTAQLIYDLRDGINLLLQKKLCNPSPIDWDGDEGKLVNAIIHLIVIDGKPEFSDSDGSGSDSD